jgi:hypothetical protein
MIQHDLFSTRRSRPGIRFGKIRIGQIGIGFKNRMRCEIDPVMKWIIECGARAVAPDGPECLAAIDTIGFSSKQIDLNLILAIAKRALGGKEREFGHSAILINRQFEFGIHRNCNRTTIRVQTRIGRTMSKMKAFDMAASARLLVRVACWQPTLSRQSPIPDFPVGYRIQLPDCRFRKLRRDWNRPAQLRFGP